jgi:hypothetical protein
MKIHFLVRIKKVDENLVKEQFSHSFIGAIASIAKFTTYKPSVDDDSIDIGFCKRGGCGTIRSPRLEAQLKGKVV